MCNEYQVIAACTEDITTGTGFGCITFLAVEDVDKHGSYRLAKNVSRKSGIHGQESTNENTTVDTCSRLPLHLKPSLSLQVFPLNLGDGPPHAFQVYAWP
ncbi:hypothetical protein PISMIDRAFT_683828 [Pisolithus microcarpus 441]|uniref:Uncharacterized protein n=1 Tax=Pisolithus microcarpus 441 TaxID=765257 RepID=A0A0C9Y256_9AGAM|nr:hypothetical protein PISMIDRAFT_683828 [Pisolithus microcarpus 441]